MPPATAILAQLKKKGTEQARKTYARHGMAPGHTFGVSLTSSSSQKPSRVSRR
jgi:hypothetical protein